MSMRDTRAQIVLVVRAFEEVDPGGRLLPLHARAAATRRALMVTGLADWKGKLTDAYTYRNGETVFRRARLLFDGLVRKNPTLLKILRTARKGSGMLPCLMFAGVAIGGAAALLLPVRAAGKLPWAVLGLLAWNLTVYTLLLIRLLWRGRLPSMGPRFVTLFVRITLWRALATWRRSRGADDDAARLAAEGLVRFAALWRRTAGPLLESRVRLLFHLAATVTAAAVMGGLAAGDAEGLRASIAATLLLVVFPRLALAVPELRRGARLAAALPVNVKSPYFRRVFSAWRGATKRVVVLPYAYRPRAGSLAALRTLLYDFFGALAGIHVCDPLEHGAAVDRHLPRGLDGERSEICLVVTFDLAAEPGAAHRDLLERLKQRLDGAADKLLVLIDGCAAAGLDGAARGARLEAWREIACGAGLEPVSFELDRPVGDFSVTDDMIAKLRRGLWPPPEAPTGASRDAASPPREL